MYFPSLLWYTTYCSTYQNFTFVSMFRAIVKTPDPLDGSDPDALSDKLVGFVHKLYFEHLLVNPKDRRIVLLDAVIGDLRVRDALVKGKYNSSFL